MPKDKINFQTPIDFWAIFICLIGFTFWSYLLTLKFNSFGFSDWDMSLYAQAMQSLCHGTTYTSLFGTSFLADHAHYISFLLVPLYALFPHPLTLINLELFSFFGGGYLFYKVASKSIGKLAALFLMIVYFIHPANIFMLLYEFHFESLAIGLIFLMFYFWSEKKWVPFLITAFVTMLTKENMALIVVMFGVYGMLFNKESKWRWGFVIFIFGLLYFSINMFILIPYIRRGMVHTSNIYLGLYSQFGGTPQEMMRNLFFHPKLLLRWVTGSLNLKYYKNCTGPFLFLSFWGPRFLMGLPILAQNILSNTSTMHTIYYHHAATLIPFAAMGAVDALGFFKTFIRQKVFVALVAFIVLSGGVSTLSYWRDWQDRANWVTPSPSVCQYMVNQIPKGASVVASFVFFSHLTDHKELYPFYNVWRDFNVYTNQQPYLLPDNIQYALIDYNDPWLLEDIEYDPVLTKKRLRNFMAQYKWKIKQRFEDIVLYEREK